MTDPRARGQREDEDWMKVNKEENDSGEQK